MTFKRGVLYAAKQINLYDNYLVIRWFFNNPFKLIMNIYAKYLLTCMFSPNHTQVGGYWYIALLVGFLTFWLLSYVSKYFLFSQSLMRKVLACLLSKVTKCDGFSGKTTKIMALCQNRFGMMQIRFSPLRK